jgi:hypothetical protein
MPNFQKRGQYRFSKSVKYVLVQCIRRNNMSREELKKYLIDRIEVQSSFQDLQRGVVIGNAKKKTLRIFIDFKYSITN